MIPPEPRSWRLSGTLSGASVDTEHLADEGVVYRHLQHFDLLDLGITVARGLRTNLGLELQSSLRLVRTRIRFEDLAGAPFLPPDPDIHHRNETLLGMGDPVLSVHSAALWNRWTISGRAGVAIPLGRTEENPFALGRQGQQHQHVQFGTGTFDPVLGLATGRRLGTTGFTVATQGRLPLYDNRHGYRAGNRFSTTVTLDRSFGSAWAGWLFFDLARENPERWDGRIEEEGNLGRTDLLLGAGMRRAWRALGHVSLGLMVPVVTDVDRGQIDVPLILTLSWIPSPGRAHDAEPDAH